MNPRPKAVIFGCASEALSREERRFFRDANPLGFILFARNCQTPDQVLGLTDALREAVGRPDAPVLIDQEGGRVARLAPPAWRAAPAAARFSELYDRDPDSAVVAAYLNGRLMAAEMNQAGVTVDCAPVLDIPQPDGDPIIGDRALGHDPAKVEALGIAVCRGLLDGAVTPTLKHIPGHGRARADSHKTLPAVEAARALLLAVDAPPFRAAIERFSDALWAMTAHVVYQSLDSRPATTSPVVIQEFIRGELNFSGILVSDDIEMAALSGPLPQRAAAALEAGCDLALHCNGSVAEMAAVADVVPALDDETWQRVRSAEKARLTTNPGFEETFDLADAANWVDKLLAEPA